jgi:uncharacterized protein
MPVLKSAYNQKPFYLINRHFETVIPSLFNNVAEVHYERERLELDDGDFLDLDWLKGNNEKVIIISHGLEGDSNRHYVKRCAKYFYKKGWDILTWNYRSCSEEMNRLPKFYSYGGTEDLSSVINYVLKSTYKQLVLCGFSMGGGLVATYLGTETIDSRISHGLTFSVSCDLKNSVKEVEKLRHIVYNKNFVNKLKEKLRKKAERFEEFHSISIGSIKSFEDFHKVYSLPYHNYKSIDDFYSSSSSKPHYKNIAVPTLMINALNDPILGNKCYPYKEAEENSNLFLETPHHGGHLGFTLRGRDYSYMELRAEEFLA